MFLAALIFIIEQTETVDASKAEKLKALDDRVAGFEIQCDNWCLCSYGTLWTELMIQINTLGEQGKVEEAQVRNLDSCLGCNHDRFGEGNHANGDEHQERT
jgi:hypothetical protein